MEVITEDAPYGEVFTCSEFEYFYVHRRDAYHKRPI